MWGCETKLRGGGTNSATLAILFTKTLRGSFDIANGLKKYETFAIVHELIFPIKTSINAYNFFEVNSFGLKLANEYIRQHNT